MQKIWCIYNYIYISYTVYNSSTNSFVPQRGTYLAPIIEPTLFETLGRPCSPSHVSMLVAEVAAEKRPGEHWMHELRLLPLEDPKLPKPECRC